MTFELAPLSPSQARSQFKSRSTANNVSILVPVPSDADSPKFKTSTGSTKWVPEKNVVQWNIKSFPVSENKIAQCTTWNTFSICWRRRTAFSCYLSAVRFWRHYQNDTQILAYHRNISINIYVLWCVPILKLFFKAGKNVWTSDSKWCN